MSKCLNPGCVNGCLPGVPIEGPWAPDSWRRPQFTAQFVPDWSMTSDAEGERCGVRHMDSDVYCTMPKGHGGVIGLMSGHRVMQHYGNAQSAFTTLLCPSCAEPTPESEKP